MKSRKLLESRLDNEVSRLVIDPKNKETLLLFKDADGQLCINKIESILSSEMERRINEDMVKRGYYLIGRTDEDGVIPQYALDFLSENDELLLKDCSYSWTKQKLLYTKISEFIESKESVSLVKSLISKILKGLNKFDNTQESNIKT